MPPRFVSNVELGGSGEDVHKRLAVDSQFVQHAEHAIGAGDVQNKATIEQDISKLLGHEGKLPAVELVFVECVTPDFYIIPRWLCGGWGLAFGHAAIAFTRADGTRRLVNITRGVGKVGENEMVEYWERPYDYIFGVHGAKGKGGVFSRSMCIVRIQEWDEHGVDAVDLYLRAMSASFFAEQRTVSWHHCGRCLELFSWLGWGRVRPSGNCSDWVSRAAFIGGLLSRPHTFPKGAVVDIFDRFILAPLSRGQAPKAEVIYIHQSPAARAAKKWQKHDIYRAWVSPIYLLRSLVYWDLAPFADVTVNVETGSDGKPVAVASRGRKRRPTWMLFPLFKHWHTLGVLGVCAAWIALGYPRNDTHVSCVVSAYMARTLTAFLILIWNAILN